MWFLIIVSYKLPTRCGFFPTVIIWICRKPVLVSSDEMLSVISEFDTIFQGSLKKSLLVKHSQVLKLLSLHLQQHILIQGGDSEESLSLLLAVILVLTCRLWVSFPSNFWVAEEAFCDDGRDCVIKHKHLIWCAKTKVSCLIKQRAESLRITAQSA